MLSLQNIVLYGLLLVSSAIGAPTVGAINETELVVPSLNKRKHDYKCEAHFHIDTSDGSLPKDSYTEKWKIDLLSKGNPPSPMGYDFTWAYVGTWAATNPDYQIKVKTTHGLELWVDGANYKGLYTIALGYVNIRNRFTLHYGSQHFNGDACENYAYKAAGPSNGWRRGYDMWCEFDC